MSGSVQTMSTYMYGAVRLGMAKNLRRLHARAHELSMNANEWLSQGTMLCCTAYSPVLSSYNVFGAVSSAFFVFLNRGMCRQQMGFTKLLQAGGPPP